MNFIKKIVDKHEEQTNYTIGLKDVYKFNPDKKFYQKVEINQKRWGQLYRGEKEPTINELERVAYYFGIKIHNILE